MIIHPPAGEVRKLRFGSKTNLSPRFVIESRIKRLRSGRYIWVKRREFQGPENGSAPVTGNTVKSIQKVFTKERALGFSKDFMGEQY